MKQVRMTDQTNSMLDKLVVVRNENRKLGAPKLNKQSLVEGLIAAAFKKEIKNG